MHCRSTRAFTVSFSDDDGNTWREGVSGSLIDATGLHCEGIPTQEFYLGRTESARFARVVLNSFYGVGAALQYVGFKALGNQCECRALFVKI